MKSIATATGLARLLASTCLAILLGAAAPLPGGNRAARTPPPPVPPASTPSEDSLPTSATLAHIAATGTVTFGVRADAKPFAYVLPDGRPGGYAVDLCGALVEDISAALGGMPLKTAYVAVTTENRIERVVSGAIDMECGSTTRNEQRLRLVAFSPVFYISGVKLLVGRNAPIRSYRDLSGRTVALTAGTTGEAAMHLLADRLLVRMKFVTLPDNGQAFATLREGKADAFATDEILLAGLAASAAGRDYILVGDYLSYEPYGLMYKRDDPGFASVIESGFHRLAEHRILATIYHRWLLEPLPTGEILSVPMSVELTQQFRALGQPD